jgi:hypothetical protein
MFCTYEDSVLEAADDTGNLTAADAGRLVKDHGLLPSAAVAELGAAGWLSAEALLEWLGY